MSAVKILTYRERVSKTKLNKLLFYADFLYFNRSGVSITGLCYAHLPLGPVPEQYELIYENLLAIDSNLQKEEDANSDYSAEFFSYASDPGTAGLSLMEIRTLLQVKEFFKTYTAKDIVIFSHQEAAYQSTIQGELISYAFAETIHF